VNLKNLVIVLISLSLIGCIGGGGSSSSVVTSSSTAYYALAKSTSFTEGSSSSQSSIKSETQWTNVDYSGSASSVHPYEQMNVHKAQSFSDGTNNLTGVGQFIHIADFNCDDDHKVYLNKTIHNLDDGGSGESAFGAADSDDYHCQAVASMAAGDGTGTGDTSGENLLSGVAPDADLILSSIPNTSGTYKTDDFAADLDLAKDYEAVASNNSWGMGDNTDSNANANWNITELKTYISDNSLSNNQGFAALMEGSSSSDAITATQSYITALDNFQNNGVIVFSSGNYSGESDVSAVAALPELFSQLSEAWLAVGMVDFTGNDISNAIESEFSLKGNKCGSAKEYCVVADGWQLNVGGYINGGTSVYPTQKSGSSLTAPMVSGGIALLSQAFPNHTPEQLTDRVLASANNSWFTPEGNTTFTTHGNGIKHGYHSTWGHGVPDFYAALKPITSNANPAMSVYTGDSIQSSNSHSLSSSYIATTPSFGNTISQGLIGEVGYAYDTLNGGFKFDMSSRVHLVNDNDPKINVSSELLRLDSSVNNVNNYLLQDDLKQNIAPLFQGNNLETSLTFGASSLPVQSFFESSSNATLDLGDFETPYLNTKVGGLGLSAKYELENSRLMIGASKRYIGSQQSIVASLEYGHSTNKKFTVMSGMTLEKDNLLGLRGSDAFSTIGAKSSTLFGALKAQSQIADNLTLTGFATLANTNMSRPDSSFINSASDVKSSSLALVASQKNILGDDQFLLSISQPNRIDNGEMSIRMANLAESDGAISYKNKSINLKAGGREISYGLSYRNDFNDRFGFSLKHVLTSNQNHIEDAKIARSSYVGLNYKDLKLGYNVDSKNALKQAEISYQYSF
tara:strand:+ start:311 stop:2872 length:2562 start_codon:yes stop_codon:yes gene_type:complete